MVFTHAHQFKIVVDADTRVSLRIPLRYFRCPVGAAVVDDDIFPVLIGLGQYALNTLGQKFLAVVNRQYHRNFGHQQERIS